MVTIGAVIAEAMAVTFWDESLTFYRMAIEMLNLYLFKGAFIQIAIGCSHLSMIALGRFRDLELAMRLSDYALSLIERCPEPLTQTRASITQNLYVNHLRIPVSSTLPALEAALETSFALGDPYLTLTSIWAMAMTRLYLGHDMAQLETFCNDSPEDHQSWMNNTGAGVCILATRQATANRISCTDCYADTTTDKLRVPYKGKHSIHLPLVSCPMSSTTPSTSSRLSANMGAIPIVLVTFIGVSP